MAGQVANATSPPNPNAVARDKPAASANPDAIAAFASAYLASGGGSPGEAGIARLYPATVIYYGKTRSRKEVVADKIRYYARWPKRAYQFDPTSLRSAPRPGSPDLTDVTFEYDFQVASGADTRSGRGNTRLTLQANGPGFLITAENGEVLKGR